VGGAPAALILSLATRRYAARANGLQHHDRSGSIRCSLTGVQPRY